MQLVGSPKGGRAAERVALVEQREQEATVSVLAEVPMPPRANRELGWQAERDLDDMVQSLWAWQSANPWGYEAPPPS